MKTAEVLWQHASISIGAEVKMPQRPLESKNTNSLPARLKTPDKGREEGTRYYLPLPRPSINPSSRTQKWGTHGSSQLHWSMGQSPFQALYSWEKLMDLNCITGEAARGRAWGKGGGSKPGGGGTEMEFRFNREEDNPSLTVCRLSLPCFPPLRTLTRPQWWFFLSGGATMQMFCARKTAARQRQIQLHSHPACMRLLSSSGGKLIMKLRHEWKPNCSCWIIDECVYLFI